MDPVDMPIARSSFNKLFIIPMNLLFLAFSLFINTHTNINWDVSWLLEASKRLLAGGTYSLNFMETNPPLILFLYAIPVLLTSSWGSLSSNFLFFTYAIMALSLGFSYLLLNRILAKDTSTKWLFFTGIAFCELILPCYEFGQREHLTSMLIMPYLLLVSALSRYQFPWYWRVSVGLMAGIGFAIKPYFLFPLILILTWQLYKNRSIPASFTLENSCLFGVMVIYFMVCFIFTPDYFSSILPLIFKFYLPYKEPLLQLISFPWSKLFYAITLLGIIQLKQKTSPYSNLLQLCMLTNFGFFLIFLMQGHIYYYHFLPVTTFSVLLLVFNIQLALRITRTKNTLSYLEYFHIVLTALCLYLVFKLVVATNQMQIIKTLESSEQELLTVFQEINHGPFVVFSNFIGPHTSLLTYSPLHSTTRIHQFWLFPGIIQLEQEGNWALAKEGRNQLRRIIIEDLLQNPPYLIMVDETSYNNILGGSTMYDLDFLLQDRQFKKIWGNYHLQKTVISKYYNYKIYTLKT